MYTDRCFKMIFPLASPIPGDAHADLDERWPWRLQHHGSPSCLAFSVDLQHFRRPGFCWKNGHVSDVEHDSDGVHIHQFSVERSILIQSMEMFNQPGGLRWKTSDR